MGGLLLLGCPSKAPPTPPDGAGPPPPSADRTGDPAAPTAPASADDDGPRYVMLGDGATLASGFSATADTARAHDPAPDAQGLGRYWILRRVAAHGEWLEVETVETTEPGFFHCVPALRAFDGYALRLYVRAEEAEPVTRRDVVVTLANRNRVTLSPGVRVTPPAREGEPATVLVDPPLPLTLPADAIGRDYAAPIRLDGGEPVAHVGRSALQLTEELALPERLGSMVLAAREQGPLTVITVADPCVRYELHVPTAAVEPPRGLGHGGGLGGGRTPRHAIAANAPVYWANGERAGVTRYEVERTDDPVRREVGRTCFAHALTRPPQSADPVLVLCFDAPDVRALGPEDGPDAKPLSSPSP